MAASQDLNLTRESVQATTRNSLPVKATTKIYQDTFVGLTAGYARPLQSGDKFVGIATRQADNTNGANADIDVEVEVGVTIQAAVTGVSGVTNVGALVYASDDQTLTLTAGSNVLVGVVKRHISSTTAAVRLLTEVEIALA